MSNFFRFVFAAMLLLSGEAWGQAQDLKVTMSFSERMFLGNTFPAGPAVLCTGYPTCRGEHVEPPPDCATITTLVTGLNLAQSGGVGGTISQKVAICALPTVTEFIYHYAGSWNLAANQGSFNVSRTDCIIDGVAQSFCDAAGAPPFTGTFKTEIPLPPVFPMVVTSNITPTSATASAQIQFKPEDVGSSGSIFVFALAPATRVLAAETEGVLKVGFAKDEKKADTPIACVLAQLNASGQMVAVTSANLAAYLTGVLSAQGASVSILNGVPTGNVAGATFFVGYGGSGTAMINTGINRAAVTVPGSLTCIPSAPQTGWWWNPLEDGRGFSLEKRGNNLFFAAFLYDISGRSTWYVSSGPVSLEGSLYNGDLLRASGGQTLGGPYVRFPTLGSAGPMTLTFNNETTGTLVWAGGTVPIQRFNIIANGVTAPPVAGVPESGWWWNEQESGRGFFMEWQGNTLDIAGYMYDDNGNSVWYLTVGEIGGTPGARSFNGNWWSYGNGQTLTGAWKPNTRLSTTVAPMTITFSGPDTALMTLPNGRITNLKRHRF
ncbi:MAG: hypothetical protein ABIR98_12190 [Usitatibacter sp.]